MTKNVVVNSRVEATPPSWSRKKYDPHDASISTPRGADEPARQALMTRRNRVGDLQASIVAL
ncbi:MAG: hypothetical protein HN758_03565 [Verrucomicrobia bacterium]|nr:hypothetical protein [Verrucomicrobiota bacterium]MBT5064184.1 hypothetical protein [Verrucomicrobiota bacterium]MBT5477703.1 hypothetical protein [Verrucomicrobiota bacterium]MBT6238079.1 hypothetical protein [Verrucomicrobiota bacterium]MBT7536643.1 hypothetical protein [Verrucomicrobiota bacterium]